MADEAERKPFLDNLTAFNEERGTTISSVPTISKQSLDLFKLYTSVRDRGGYKEVTRAKLWKECAQCCGITISSSAAYTLKKQYIKLLLPYECKFDRNGISPEAMMAETESVSRKNAKNKASVAPSPGPSDSNSQGSYPQSGTPGSVDHGSSSNSYPPPHPSPSGSPYPGPGYTPTHSSPSASPYPAGPGYPPQPPTSFAGAHGHPGYPPHHGGHPHWSEHGPPPGSSPHQYGPGSGPHQPNYHGNQMYPPNPGAPSGPPNSRPVPAAPSKPYPPIGPAGQSPSPSPTSQNEANNIPSYQSSPYPNAQQIKRHPTDYMREPQAHPNNYPHGHPGNQYHHPNNTPTRPGPTPQGHHPQWNHHNQWNGDSRGYPANYPSSNGSSAAGYPNYKPGTRESWDSSAKPDANSWNMNRYGHQANSNQSYGPQSGTPSSQSHTAAPSAAPQQPPPSAPGQQGPNMNSSMPSNPPMGNYGSQTSNQQQHAAPSPDANSWNMNRYGHQANSNQSYGPQSGTPGSQSHTAAPSAAPQQPPPSAPGQQGPSMNSSMPSNPPMGSYGSQTGNQQHAAPSPGPQSQQRPGSNQGPASAPLPYPNGVPNNTTQRTFSPLQRLLTKPIQSTQQPNYPGNQMYPPVAGPQIVPPSRQAPPVATSKPSPYPPAPVAQAPSPSPAGPADHSAMPGGYPSSPYSNPQPPVKRHPDFSKEPQPYSNNYPHGHHGAPPSGQYGGYPGTLTRPGPPAVTQAPPHHSQWNGDSRNYSSGYPAATNGANAPGYPPNFRPGTREGWNQSPKPDASSWGAYRHGQPVGPAGSQSSGPQAGRPSDYPNAGPLHQMGRMNSQFSPRPPADQNARQMYPPTNAGSQLPPNKMPPPSMHGPPREIQTNQAGFPGPHHGQQIPPHLSHSSFQPIAKELNFPPNIVEGVLPKLVKRRRMTSKDLSHVDTGRLLMCLKSGMLAESTWALDVLSVLIFDDNTLMYYGLQKKLPGLLDVLLEHYTKYLAEIFEGIFNLDTQGEDISNGEDNTSVSCMRKRRRPRANKKWYELDKDFSGSSVPLSCPSSMDLEVEKAVDSCSLNIPKKDEQLLLLNSNLNFTLRSRDGKPVKIENKSEGCNPLEEEKRWETLFESNSSDSGFHDDDDDASHIQTQFESKEKFVRFARILKEKNTNMTSASVHVANQVSQKQPEINSSPVNKKPIPEQAEKMDCTDSKPLEYPCFRTPKRKHVSDCDLEDESLQKDDFPLCPVDEYCDSLVRRCLCLSTIIRNISFVQGNDGDMVKHHGLMFILSRLLLLNHYHPKKKRISEPSSKVNSDEKDSLFNEDEVMSEVKSDDLSKTDVQSDEDDDSLYDSTDLEWYWDAIHLILENSLVTLANISGQLDMSPFPEHISLPLLDGLLHWAVCTSSYAKDHLPTTSLPVISPQRLALETLVKLSILEGNVDLILATPPWERLDRLFKQLTKSLSRSEDQTLREFSLVLLGNFAASDTGTARSIALTGNAIPQLLAFVEETEQQAMGIASSRGINALRENPELMGTTLDMVRRAAICMRHLARMPENRQLFVNFQQRLLALVMSQILDQGVAAIIADVMYECALSEPVHSSPTPFFPTINLNELIDKRAKSAERLTNGSPEDADFKPDIDPKPSHFKEPIKPEPVQPSNDTVAAKSG